MDPLIDDDLTMTAGEFRMVREYLGLTAEWVASRLGVALRTVRRWEAGTSPVPEGVREQMEAWEADTAHAVEVYVEQLMDTPEPFLRLVGDDDPDRDLSEWPPRWQRHVAARAAVEVPGLRVGYASEYDGS